MNLKYITAFVIICGWCAVLNPMVAGATVKDDSCPVVGYAIHIFHDQKNNNIARCLQVRTKNDWSFTRKAFLSNATVNIRQPAFCRYYFQGQHYTDDTAPEGILNERAIVKKGLVHKRTLDAMKYFNRGVTQKCGDDTDIAAVLGKHLHENTDLLASLGIQNNTDWQKLVSNDQHASQVDFLLANFSVTQWQYFVSTLSAAAPNKNLPFALHAFESPALKISACQLDLPGFEKTAATTVLGCFALAVHQWLHNKKSALGYQFSANAQSFQSASALLQQQLVTLTRLHAENQTRITAMGQMITGMQKAQAAQAKAIDELPVMTPTPPTAATTYIASESDRPLQTAQVLAVLQKVSNVAKNKSDEVSGVKMLMSEMGRLNNTMTEGNLTGAVMTLVVLVALLLLVYIGFNLLGLKRSTNDV